jgi:hypothetical protein
MQYPGAVLPPADRVFFCISCELYIGASFIYLLFRPNYLYSPVALLISQTVKS